MSWLIELLIEGVREVCSQFLVDMMDLLTNMFTELVSCDLSLFEDLFGVVKDLYENAILPLGIAILLLILIWQLFKTMFGRGGVTAEDPVELVCRSCICLFFVIFARPLANYILSVAGTPYQWVAGTEIEVESFSDFVNALDALSAGLGISTLSITILMLIMQFVVAWNYFKMLFIIAERYVLLGVFSYTSPLAFATGGSKATNNILASWAKMFGGQVVLIIMNAWCMKMFLSGYGNLMATGLGFTQFFIAALCLVGFCKIAYKLDSYMAALGVNLGRPSNGIGAMGLMMAASRLFSHTSGYFGGTGNASSENESSSNNGEGEANMSGGSGPIPMSPGGVEPEEMNQSPVQETEGESTEAFSADTGFDEADDQNDVLEEMGAAPEMDQTETEEKDAGAAAIFESNGDQTILTDEDGNPVPSAGEDEMFGNAGMVENDGETSESFTGIVEDDTEQGTAYAENVEENDPIPMGEGNEEWSEQAMENGETVPDYPREEEEMEMPGMDLVSGGVTEKDMDLEGAANSSAGGSFSDGEYDAKSGAKDHVSSESGILNEIVESTISGESIAAESGYSEMNNPDMEVSGHIKEHTDTGKTSSSELGKGELLGKDYEREDILNDGVPLTEQDFHEMGSIPSAEKNYDTVPDNFHTVPKSRKELHRGRKDDTEF